MKSAAAGPARRGSYLSTVFPLGFFVAAIGLGLTPEGGMLNIIYMPAAAALGLLLLLQQPTAYLGFVMWTWMLTPLVRRLSDLQSGYHDVSVAMIAPLAVTVLCVLTPLRHHRGLVRRGIGPYVFYLAVLVYGFFVGAIGVGLPAAALAFANWAVPVLFALHLLASPETAQDKARAILRALIFGTVAIGAYGVIQFVLMPPWDANWMIESELTSIGAPLPFQVRVFGPLNSPGPYAAFVAAGVITAFATRSVSRTPAIAAGAIGLLLSLVRAVWGAWFIGMMLIFARSSPREKTRFLLLGGIALVLVAPVLILTPLGETVSERFQTLGDTQNDVSFVDRQALYTEFTAQALNSVTGVGLGQIGAISTRLGQSGADALTSIDSGLLESFYTFGILASVLFGSMLAMVARAWPRPGDPFAIALMAVAISGLPILAFGNPLIGAPGMLIFPFLALARQFRDASRALPAPATVQTPALLPASAR